MSYTKRGPFVNASPTGPWVDADFFNNVEAALVAENAMNFAPVATGVAATDTANLTAAISAAQAAHLHLYVPGGTQRYVLNAGITWDLSRGSMIGVGDVDLDFTALTTGYAFRVIGSPSATGGDTAIFGGGNYYSGRPATNEVRNFRLQGPQSESSTVDGMIVYADPTTVAGVEPAQGSIEKIMIRGFRDGLVHGLGSFLVKNRDVFTQKCWRRGLSLTTGTGLGENISFYGCTFNANNSTGTGVAVYTDPAAIADCMFYGCSFDYSDIEFDHNSGDITLAGCHIENGSPGPMVQLASTGNGTTFTVFGGSWRASGVGAPRDHLVEVKASTTGDVTFTVTGGGGGPATLATQFFVNNSTTLPSVSINNFTWIGGRHAGAAYTTFGDYLNQLVNGNFDASTSFAASGVAGWAAGGIAGVTHTIGTANAKSGNAVTITGTGTTGVDITHQMVAIGPRRTIAVSADISVPAFTAGSFQVMVVFYGVDRTTALSTYRVSNGLAATQTYQTNIARMVPPQGAAFADVQLQAINWNGTAAVDNIQLTVL